MFAVLGVFIDFTGQGQLCVTKEHETIHIGHELEQPWIDESPAGPAAHARHHQGGRGRDAREPARRREASSRAQDGRRSSPTRTARAASNDVIVPALKKAKVEDRLDGGAQHHRHRHDGGAGPARQLHREVEEREASTRSSWPACSCRRSSSSRRSRPRCPTSSCITDADATAGQGQDQVAAGTTPNPYEGMLGDDRHDAVRAVGEQERAAPAVRRHLRGGDRHDGARARRVRGRTARARRSSCRSRSPTSAASCSCSRTSPRRSARTSRPRTGRRRSTSSARSSSCATDIASLCKGKYAADDAFRLVAFDSSVGERHGRLGAGRPTSRTPAAGSAREAPDVVHRERRRRVRSARCCAGSPARRCRGTTPPPAGRRARRRAAPRRSPGPPRGSRRGC